MEKACAKRMILENVIFVMGDPMFVIRVKEMAEFHATDAMRQVLSACLAANVVGQEVSMVSPAAIAPMGKKVKSVWTAVVGAILIAQVAMVQVLLPAICAVGKAKNIGVTPAPIVAVQAI